MFLEEKGNLSLIRGIKIKLKPISKLKKGYVTLLIYTVESLQCHL